MMKMKIKYLVLALLAAVTLNLCLRDITFAKDIKDFNALAPLDLQTEPEWGDFKRLLAIAQQMGIDAIATDIWWGKVEKQGDQQFNWEYYDRLVQAIAAADLHWIPLLSFHQCGGNVGDHCDIPIPDWIWTHFSTVTPEMLQYVSENGNASSEVVSLWVDQWVMPEYEEFMLAFLQRYGKRADIIDEIQISLGSAGELRYPAYNAHDNYQYPHRGYFQAYSTPAQVSFRKFVRDQYGSLTEINQKWNTNLTAFAQIQPPQELVSFVEKRHYLNTQYGKDFINWYNQSLIDHGQRILQLADQTLTEEFSEIPLGIKIPGIHWQIAHPKTPRIAEITTGLIPSSIPVQKPVTGYGYMPLLEVAHALDVSSREVILHYTAVELSNERDQHLQANSRAKELVGWIATTASDLEIPIKAENALQGELNNPQAWKNINTALRDYQFSGFTALRLAHVTEQPFARRQYRNLIQKQR